MQINTNITAMNTLRLLNNASQAQSKSMAKLSSGLRINSAADDAAGLSISEKMKGQIRGLDQASRNAQDGISMTQTAEGALNETTDILQRMRELATQSANDTNTDQDRSAIQDEMNQLTDEVNRIGNTTEFNTQKLLNGGNAGPVQNVQADSAFTNAAVTGASGLTGDTDHTIAITYNAGTSATTIAASTSLTKAGTGTATGTISGTYTGTSDISSITVAKDSTTGDWTVNGDTVTPSTNDLSWNGLTISFDDISNTANGDTFTYTGDVNAEVAAGYTATIDDSAVTGTVSSGAGSQTYTTADGKSVTADLGTFDFAADGDGTTNNITFDQTQGGTGFSATLQIGANTGQSMTLNISDMRAAALGLSSATGGTEDVTDSDGNTVTASFTATQQVTDGTNNDNTEYALDLSSSDKASAAISVIDNAINTVSSERSKLGAYENRLDHTINNLNTSSQNITEASSRITDVDMASEMSEQTKDSILSQAAQAMLAQANQQPQQVLQLLRG
ncbi:flagellin [Pullulanibacillus sp. KACC 23026]|uniref:flagellin N-terminal helical domain-containing protein n=1 Tax=Pullulanibacillus sp. KACC 23026 TaxID=3028315 RepID=UPI0023AF469B|nr:flagellin [Pullulanibacillus sp. KACC 23026]WEG11253.1 flagellin [Pullulanibacillus sp. KACC 23026]